MGIYVWGVGCGASELVEKGLEPGRITAFVDSFPKSDVFLGRPVLKPEELPVEDCDLMIVTTRQAEAVALQCCRLGIREEKLFFLKNSCLLLDRNQDSVAAAYLGEALTARLTGKQHLVPRPMALAQSALPADELDNDYVRLSALELLCRRLEGVAGACAELGVYRGRFARCIQTLLPRRKLYLFDSFAGFAPTDGAGQAMQDAHAAVTPADVLAVLPAPEMARLRSGFFPASLDGLEERFCLVSLDVDFLDTTLEGLRYFWPRLETGGYLLLHDWANPELPGVARALEVYQREIGAVLPAVPLPDRCGTLVLCRN